MFTWGTWVVAGSLTASLPSSHFLRDYTSWPAGLTSSQVTTEIFILKSHSPFSCLSSLLSRLKFNLKALLAWETHVNIAKASEVDD